MSQGIGAGFESDHGVILYQPVRSMNHMRTNSDTLMAQSEELGEKAGSVIVDPRAHQGSRSDVAFRTELVSDTFVPGTLERARTRSTRVDGNFLIVAAGQ
jgi:hypothetical protein